MRDTIQGDNDDYLNPESIDSILGKLEALQQLRECEYCTTDIVISYDKFEDIQKPDGGRAHPTEGYRGCKAHRMFVVLHCNGELMVCMYHLFDQRFVLGNVYRHNLKEIWASEQRRKVIAFCEYKLNHILHQCQICCKGHEINKMLFRAEEMDTIKTDFSMNTTPFL